MAVTHNDGDGPAARTKATTAWSSPSRPAGSSNGTTAAVSPFASRAVAVLGFDGVIVALLLQGFGIEATAAVWVLLFITTALLLISAGYAVGTVVPHTVAMPSVLDLRAGWAAHAASPKPRYAGPLVAESLLHESNLNATSPLSAAKEESDTRARRAQSRSPSSSTRPPSTTSRRAATRPDTRRARTTRTRASSQNR